MFATRHVIVDTTDSREGQLLQLRLAMLLRAAETQREGAQQGTAHSPPRRRDTRARASASSSSCHRRGFG